jgi:hypothetical protein
MQIESRYAHRAAWWLTIVACCAVLIPRLCTPGCYVDGNLYALIARNMSIGIGSAWDPFGSPGCFPHFHEHPPLGLIMEVEAAAELLHEVAAELLAADSR